MIELEGHGKEKRARPKVTRPEPTIYGNCDSWNFIVGKKPGTYSPPIGKQGTLQCNNGIFIHSLFTTFSGGALDNLWVICGSPVYKLGTSRMVDFRRSVISKTRHGCAQFYLNLSQVIRNVSVYTLYFRLSHQVSGRCSIDFFRLCYTKKAPKT